jgi:hypothetical protein
MRASSDWVRPAYYKHGAVLVALILGAFRLLGSIWVSRSIVPANATTRREPPCAARSVLVTDKGLLDVLESRVILGALLPAKERSA